jgi:ketosteroid isomerase-like protein
VLEDENKQTVRRFYESVWNNGDIAAIDEIFASDFVNNDPGPHPADRDGFKRYVAYARETAGALRSRT